VFTRHIYQRHTNTQHSESESSSTSFPAPDEQAGDTPLVLSVCQEHWICSELLLSFGGAAALRARDMLDWTPLHYALAMPACPPDPQKLLRDDDAGEDSAAAAWIEAASSIDPPLRAAAEAEVLAIAAGAELAAAVDSFRLLGVKRGNVYVLGRKIAFREFSSVRAGCFCPTGAKGYYEVELLSEACSAQFGFCNSKWHRSMWFGGAKDSWAVNSHSVMWRDDEEGTVGCKWRRGDIIGLACNLAPAAASSGDDLADSGSTTAGGGRVLVSVNGDFSAPNGATFDLPRGLTGLYPALSGTFGVVCYNLGGDPARPLRHAPPDPSYRAMAAFSAVQPDS
jgi:hypothetical protein